MRLTDVDFGDALPIDGYGPGFFRIGGKVHEGAVFLLGTTVTGWDGGADPIVAEATAFDVLLYGSGAEMAHAPKDFVTACEAVGIGVEVMASPSACRTYNVLLGEGRRVAVALLPVGVIGG